MKECLSKNKVIFVKLARPTKKAFRLLSLFYTIGHYTNNQKKEPRHYRNLKEDPIFVLQRIANNNRYPFTLQARDQTEFTRDFETTGICCYQIQIECLNSKQNFDLIIEESMIGNQNQNRLMVCFCLPLEAYTYFYPLLPNIIAHYFI